MDLSVLLIIIGVLVAFFLSHLIGIILVVIGLVLLIPRISTRT